MRKLTLALLTGLSLLVIDAASFTTPAEAQSCRELRRACEMRDQLGERGQGNCRRFREQCQQQRVDCGALRRACMFKDERGQQGQGNCRRFRELCQRG